jgi:uncharacterized protein (DUF3820 family)
MKMPFGKHKGEDLEDIPTSYLQWVAENVEGREALITEVELQLTMREGAGAPRQAEDFNPGNSQEE